MEPETQANTDVEVAPQVDSAPSQAADEAPDSSPQAPEATPSDKEPELILGKFKSSDDLAKSYQELESLQGRVAQSVNDPEFIYQQAVRLGMVPQGETAPESAPPIAQPQVDIGRVVDERVNAQLDYKEALLLMPELKTDRELQAMAGALVDSGKSHVEAAKVLQKRIGQFKQQGEVLGAEKAKTTLTDRELAQTATNTQPVNSDAAETEDLMQRSKSKNPKVQQAAIIELLARKNRARTA